MLGKSALVIAFLALVQFSGCNSSNGSSEVEKAKAYCVDQNGTVDTLELNSTKSIEVCISTQVGDSDNGSEEHTYTCELMDFYHGTCDKDVEENNSSLVQVVYIGNYQSYAYYKKVKTILKNIDNTGYTHRPFMLNPDIGENMENYDLFLDCSGFVGYYVLQQLSPKLYSDLPRKYSCGPLTKENGVISRIARPLAADFVEYIKASSSVSHNSATVDDDENNQCWGRVENLKDARPGDVIAYVHKGNIDKSTKYCCRKTLKDDNNTYYSTKLEGNDTCDAPNRIIYKTKLDSNGNHKSTGHVMFITKTPYKSTKCKDVGQCKYSGMYSNAKYQWVVRVADSTNVIHTSDTRDVGIDASKYGEHKYHAWTSGTVEKCVDGSYHRLCSEHDTTKVDDVNVTGSSKPNHPTGIGMGYIYVNDAMDGYRTKYSADISDAEIVIGRPIRCQ